MTVKVGPRTGGPWNAPRIRFISREGNELFGCWGYLEAQAFLKGCERGVELERGGLVDG